MPITSYGVKGLIGHALKSHTPLSNTLAALAFVADSALSAGQSEILDFIGAIPAMQPLVGGRQNAIPIAHNYQVQLDKFETSVVIPRDWSTNDKTGLVQARINQIPTRRDSLYGARVAALLNANGIGFDGVTFFNAAHPWGNDNAINSPAAAPGTPTPDEAAAAIFAAYTQMLGFVDDRGEPCNEALTALTIVAGVGAIGGSLMQAVKQQRLDTGAGTRDNPVLGIPATLDIIITPRITANDTFYVVNRSAGAAPIAIVRNPNSLHVDSKAEGSDFEYDNDAWAFGIMETMQAGYGLPSDACSVTFA